MVGGWRPLEGKFSCSIKKVDDLFDDLLVVALNTTQAKTAKLTTATVQPSAAQQKFP